jgi:GNAT superfamily N-acetyltransferase
MSYQILGYGYTWWCGDPLPDLPPLFGFSTAPTDDYSLVAELAQLELQEVQRRVQGANRPYVAYLGRCPVAYGWSAAKEGSIHELQLNFAIPTENRYFWDFVTLPAWRGQGIYPRMLQAILSYERVDAHRFWIGHTADNQSSARGIIKAGFQQVEALVVFPDERLKIMAVGHSARAQVSPMGLRLGVLQTDSNEQA